ncbi:50S ribosomal protein L25 [Glycine soja]
MIAAALSTKRQVKKHCYNIPLYHGTEYWVWTIYFYGKVNIAHHPSPPGFSWLRARSMHALAMSPSEETISIIVAVGHGSHRRHQCTHGLLPHHMHRHRSTQMPLHAPQCHRKRTFHIERPTLYYPSYDGHNFLNLSTFHDDLYLESLELSLWIASFPVFPTFSSNKRWWRLRAYSFRGTRIPRVSRRPPAEGSRPEPKTPNLKTPTSRYREGQAKTIMAAQWWRSAAGHLRTVAAGRGSLSGFQRSTYHTIQAIPRECSGSKVSARDRTQGRIPCVVFLQNLLEKNPDARSESKKHLLTVEKKQIKAILDSADAPFFCSTRFPLQIRAGSGSSHLLESGTVLPIKIHRDEESGKILNLVFVWAEDGMKLKVDVPVVFEGEDACPGVQKGGILNKIRPSLKFLCPSEHIPSKIVVDVSNLDIEDRIFMRDIEVHPSLKLLSKNESMPICKIVPTSLGNKEPIEA